MKKVILMVAAVAAALGMNAKTVSPAKALSEARDFCHASELKGALRSAGPSANMQVVYTHPEGGYYVVSRGAGAGYVIVAGDDCSPLILGYTTSGDFNFSEMPEPAREWLEGYAKQVAVSAKAGVAYQESEGSDHNKISTLLTTTWNQKAPYNDMCPKFDAKEENTGHCPTGCVATAMAQVLNYHKWPEKAQGTGQASFVLGVAMDGHEVLKELPKIDMNNDTFDWDKMQNTYAAAADADGAGTAEQRAAVALLMRDCGYSVDMHYANTSSGAIVLNIPIGLVNNLGYDKGVLCTQRAWYTDEEWDNVVYNELSTNGPVLYAGVTAKSEGHEFVCDGYNGDGYYHFNWGWGGLADGYFKLSALNPTIQGTGGSSSSLAFDYQHVIITGMKKPVAGSVQPDLLSKESDLLPYDGHEGYLKCTIMNHATKTFTGEVGFKVTNEATKEVTYSSSQTITLAPKQYVLAIEDKSELADGTYRIRTAYKPEGGEWTECKYDISSIYELVVTVENGKKTYSSDRVFEFTEKSVMDAVLIDGRDSQFVLTLQSNGGTHKAQLWYGVEDMTTKQTVWKHESEDVDFNVYQMGGSLKCTIDACTGYDKTHAYSLKVYDGNEVLAHADSLDVMANPVFEVIEPLKLTNAVDGKIAQSEEAYVTMKMKNVNNVPLKLFMAETNNDGAGSSGSYSSYLLPEDQPMMTITDNIITFDGELSDGFSFLFYGKVDRTVDVVITYKINDTNEFYLGDSKEKAHFTVLVVDDDESGINEVTGGSATVEKSEVYNLQGIRMAEGAGQLPAGLYIVRSKMSDGSTTVTKQLVK